MKLWRRGDDYPRVEVFFVVFFCYALFCFLLFSGGGDLVRRGKPRRRLPVPTLQVEEQPLQEGGFRGVLQV